jgi:hypothetical protein
MGRNSFNEKAVGGLVARHSQTGGGHDYTVIRPSVQVDSMDWIRGSKANL